MVSTGVGCAVDAVSCTGQSEKSDSDLLQPVRGAVDRPGQPPALPLADGGVASSSLEGPRGGRLWPTCLGLLCWLPRLRS